MLSSKKKTFEKTRIIDVINFIFPPLMSTSWYDSLTFFDLEIHVQIDGVCVGGGNANSFGV